MQCALQDWEHFLIDFFLSRLGFVISSMILPLRVEIGECDTISIVPNDYGLGCEGEF